MPDDCGIGLGLMVSGTAGGAVVVAIAELLRVRRDRSRRRAGRRRTRAQDRVKRR